MKELFPRKQVIGFIFSLVLTAVALLVYFMDMSFAVGMTILLVTAFIQAGLQLILFMHAGESEDKTTIYTSIYYGMAIAIITVLGTLLTLVWTYQFQ
ncbi:cytochrome aa3 quinol oxidase subunit IV [Cytobacillus purgationiresistens]|nr:cytochrome aa3 quinol oxidase subunit IV [Cytobacillus purgationiresistens]